MLHSGNTEFKSSLHVSMASARGMKPFFMAGDIHNLCSLLTVNEVSNTHRYFSAFSLHERRLECLLHQQSLYNIHTVRSIKKVLMS